MLVIKDQHSSLGCLHFICLQTGTFNEIYEWLLARTCSGRRSFTNTSIFAPVALPLSAESNSSVALCSTLVSNSDREQSQPYPFSFFRRGMQPDARVVEQTALRKAHFSLAERDPA